MSFWIDHASCRGHESPNLWTPASVADPAHEARRICRGCPVRLECGERALRDDEKHTVAGGYRMWDEEDRDALCRELPHVAASLGRPKRRSMSCSDCGEHFRTTRNLTRCAHCRMGLVRADATRAVLIELRRTMSTAQISQRTGIVDNTLSGIVSLTKPPVWVKATTAQRVMALAQEMAVSA